MKQGFGWDTSPIQTNSTQLVAIYTSNLQTQLSGANCTHIAPWPRPNDNQIKMTLLRQSSILPRFGEITIKAGILSWQTALL